MIFWFCFYEFCNYICGACPSPCFSSLIYYKGIQVCDGRQIRCISYNKITYFDLDDICKLCFDSYDLHDVADTKVMSEFLHRDGDRYWVTVDGVRQLYRRIECKMCFEVIEKLKKL